MNRTNLVILFASFLALVSVISVVFVMPLTNLNEDLEIPSVTPKLSVEGNLIVTDNNVSIILRGAAIEDPAISSREIFFGAKEEDAEVFKEWGFNLIRIPVNPETYKKDDNYFKKYVDPIVGTATKKGIYVLLGWHGHGNPFTGEVERGKDGSPITLWQADMSLTKDFWAEASKRYAGNTAVLYSIFNEPAFMGWDEWKKGAEEIIGVIRAHDPGKIIFVSGTEWGADLGHAGKNPIKLENIVYEVHPYPYVYWRSQENYRDKWDKYFGYLADRYPVFAGEWGYQPNSEIESINATTELYGRPLTEYMKEKGISWSAWVWSDIWYPPMLKNWDYEPTEFGALVKEYLQE